MPVRPSSTVGTEGAKTPTTSVTSGAWSVGILCSQCTAAAAHRKYGVCLTTILVRKLAPDGHIRVPICKVGKCIRKEHWHPALRT